MCTHIIGERCSKIHAIIANSSLNHKMMLSLDVSGSGKRQLFRSFPDGKTRGIEGRAFSLERTKRKKVVIREMSTIWCGWTPGLAAGMAR